MLRRCDTSVAVAEDPAAELVGERDQVGLELVEVLVQVDETDVPQLALGDTAEVEIDAFPGEKFTGSVTAIGNSAIRPPSAQVQGGNPGQQAAIDFDDVMLNNGPWNPARAYSQSTLAQILFTVELADRLPVGESPSVNALHPSTYMDTNMVRGMGQTPISTVAEGAEATLKTNDEGLSVAQAATLEAEDGFQGWRPWSGAGGLRGAPRGRGAHHVARPDDRAPFGECGALGVQVEEVGDRARARLLEIL